jgi:hypothetical protein
MFTFCDVSHDTVGASDLIASNDTKGSSHSPTEVQSKHFPGYTGGIQESPQMGQLMFRPGFEPSPCKIQV